MPLANEIFDQADHPGEYAEKQDSNHNDHILSEQVAVIALFEQDVIGSDFDTILPEFEV